MRDAGKRDSVLHDITPDIINNAINPLIIEELNTTVSFDTNEKKLQIISMQIDISSACRSPVDLLQTGTQTLVVSVLKGNTDQLLATPECVNKNNIYESPIQVDCRDGERSTLNCIIYC